MKEKDLKEEEDKNFNGNGESMVDITTAIHIIKTKALFRNFKTKLSMLFPPTLT